MMKAMIVLLFVCTVLAVASSEADAHGWRGRGSGHSYHHSYGYRVPMYRSYYYAPVPVYAPPIYGPPVVHHSGLLDYVIVLPLRFLFGHDEVVPPPNASSNRKNANPPVEEEDLGY